MAAFGTSGFRDGRAKKQPFHRWTGRLGALGLGIVTPSHLIFFCTGE